MTKSVLIAGLLGGLLGGIASFAASRFIKPVEPAKSQDAQHASEAREVTEAFVAKLKAARFDEFALDAKSSTGPTEEDFATFKTKLNDSRIVYTKLLGPSTGEFELLKETLQSPSLARFVYLERFERGGIVWSFVLYKRKDGWRLAWVDYGPQLAGIFGGL
jgi:hypothetical protein